MHARLETNVLRERTPVRLTPIQWGRKDAELASGVLHSVARTTPPRVIPFNAVLGRKLRDWLDRNGVAHG